MTEKTTNFFSFDIPGTARKAGKTANEIYEGVAREQIAGATEYVDLSTKQFDMLIDAANIEDMIKANRELFSGSFEIVREHTGNAIKIFLDTAGKFISSEKGPVDEVMKKADEAVVKTTKMVEDVAA